MAIIRIIVFVFLVNGNPPQSMEQQRAAIIGSWQNVVVVQETGGKLIPRKPRRSLAVEFRKDGSVHNPAGKDKPGSWEITRPGRLTMMGPNKERSRTVHVRFVNSRKQAMELAQKMGNQLGRMLVFRSSKENK